MWCTRCTPISFDLATRPSRSGSKSTVSATAVPFATRRVVARQATGAILNLSSSFQAAEEGHDEQAAVFPDVPSADALEKSPWSPVFDRAHAPAEGRAGVAMAWMRMTDDIGDDPIDNACAFAFLSDDMPTEAVMALHPERDESFETLWSASLDHAIWFHRPQRADAWHLQRVHLWGADELTEAWPPEKVFTETGQHVATVAQEVLMRSRR